MDVRLGRWRVRLRARLLAVLLVSGLLLESGAVLLVPLLRTQAAETTVTGIFASLYAHTPDGSPPVSIRSQ